MSSVNSVVNLPAADELNVFWAQVAASLKLAPVGGLSTVRPKQGIAPIRYRKSAALRHHAEDSLPRAQPARVDQLVQHDEKRGRTGVAFAAEVGEPALFRQREVAVV